MREHEWEYVDQFEYTARMSVPGGWLYRWRDSGQESDVACVCFVPAPQPPAASAAGEEPVRIDAFAGAGVIDFIYGGGRERVVAIVLPSQIVSARIVSSVEQNVEMQWCELALRSGDTIKVRRRHRTVGPMDGGWCLYSDYETIPEKWRP